MNTENAAGSNSFGDDDDNACDDSDDPNEPAQHPLLSSRDTIPRGHARPLDWRNSQSFYGHDEEQRLDGKTLRFVPVPIKFQEPANPEFSPFRTLRIGLIYRFRSWAQNLIHGGQYDPASNDASIAEARGRTQLTNSAESLLTTTSTSSPQFPATVRNILAYSWVNLLLVFVPLGIVTYVTKVHPAFVFTLNAIAIIPLSGLLTCATENIARDLGDTVGALMNVSFGNMIELVIFTALMNNQIRIVQASLLGSILVNLLLILGTAIVVGGVKYQEQVYSIATAQVLACLLCFSVFSVLIPTAFYHSFSDAETAERAVLKFSRVCSVTLLIVYLLYLLFQLKSHASLTRSVHQGVLNAEFIPRTFAQRNHASIFSGSSIDPSLPPLMTMIDRESRARRSTSNVTASENAIELGKVDPREPPESRTKRPIDSELGEHIPNDAPASQERAVSGDRLASTYESFGMHPSPPQPLSPAPSPLRSLSTSQRSSSGTLNQDSARPRPQSSGLQGAFSTHETMATFTAPISRTASLILLLISSLFVAICSSLLVNTIDDMVSTTPLTAPFIGLIILPIAGNVAEQITALIVARKNKMDLAIGVSVGSSIQIALFITPVVVIVGWILDRDMALCFSLFETVTLAASAFVVVMVILNGKTNYLEGAMLCACYVIVAVGAFWYPGPEAETPT